MKQALENRPTKDQGAFVERSCTYQKKGSNHQVDEIADNRIVDINLNIVVGDEAVQGPSSYGLQNNQEVHFNVPFSERKLKEVSLGIDYWIWTYK